MATTREIAGGMLRRYSSSKVALEMAQLHSHDYTPGSDQYEHWRRVAAEIQRLARVGPDGRPRARHGDRRRAARGARGLWTVDYRTVRRREGGVGLLWHVGVVRARFSADAIEAIRRLEARRGLTIRDVTVVPGDLPGYPRSRIVDANTFTRSR